MLDIALEDGILPDLTGDVTSFNPSYAGYCSGS